MLTMVKDLKVGQATVRGTLSIKPDITNKKGQGEQKPYYRASLDDNTGKVYFNVWNDTKVYPELKDFADGDYVELEIGVEKVADGNKVKYTTAVMLGVKKAEPVGKSGVVDGEKLKAELRTEISSMEHPILKQLMFNVFKRDDVKEAFFKAPSSEKTAYAHETGLLTHVVRIMKLSKAVAEVFSSWTFNIDGFNTKLNVDLLKTCAVLHDIGKLKTLRMDGNKIVKTKEGELFEDSYLTAKILFEELAKVELIEEEKILLEHAVTSSKEQLKFGALNVPRTREAIAFHLIEKLDVQMANFEFLERTAYSGEEFSKLFEKVLYFGVFDEA